MRQTIALFLALLGCLCLPAFAGAGNAAEALTLTASAVEVGIEGSSTLHHWRVSAGSVTVTALCRPSGADWVQGLRRGDLASLDILVGADSIRSAKSPGMDRDIRRAMEPDKFPDIRFTLRRYQIQGLSVTAQGDLGIHGVVKQVVLNGLLAPKDGALAVGGVYPMVMSDYGVKPPAHLMGLLRASDRVRIVFSFRLSK